MKGNDEMSETPQLSEAKRALLEKRLRGGFPQAAKAANAIHQDAKVEITSSSERVVAIQTGGSKRPFFFLHGEWRLGAFYCYPLAQALGTDQPFYALAPYTFEGLGVLPSLETIARFHLEELLSIQPEGPYLLGGWCNGALVAYEMARQLYAQGQTVELLVLMYAMFPGRHRLLRSIISRLGSLVDLGQEKQLDCFLIVQHVYRYLRFPYYRQLKNSERMKTGERGHTQAIEGFGHPRHDGLFTSTGPLRQHYPNVFEWVNAGYAPSLYPGKITFFWVSEEPQHPLGWRKAVRAKEGEVEMYMIPGNYITSRTEYLPVLAERLRECFSKAQALT